MDITGALIMHDVRLPVVKSDRTRNGPLHSFPAMDSPMRALNSCRRMTPRLFSIGAAAALTLLAADTRTCAAPLETQHAQFTNAHEHYVVEASQRFSIPASWIRAVIQVESAGNALAVSPKGASGLMQLMPETWSDLRSKYQLGDNPFDPHDNVLAGTAYLREMLDRFGTSGFLAAYNAGPTHFEGYLAGRWPLPGETKQYLSALAQLLPDLPIESIVEGSRSAERWRFAGLFVGQSTMPSTSNDVTACHNKPTLLPVQHRALIPQSNGLFVPSSTAAPR